MISVLAVGNGPGTGCHWTLDGVILTNQASIVVRCGGGASMSLRFSLMDGVQLTLGDKRQFAPRLLSLSGLSGTPGGQWWCVITLPTNQPSAEKQQQ